MIEKLIKQLIEDEGLKLKPYTCPAGRLTIGVGRNLEENGLRATEIIYLIQTNPGRSARFGDISAIDKSILAVRLCKDFEKHGINAIEAVYLLRNDVERVLAELERALPWYTQAPEPIQIVLANMAFNLGLGGLLGFKTTLELLKTGQYTAAADNMLKSRWARQVGRRARRLADMVRTVNH